METSGDGHYALSFEQEQFWFLDELRSGAREYLLHWAFRLRGQLDRDALTAALTEITNRHEVLRTRYTTVDGAPVQVVDEPAPVDLAIVDLTGYPPDDWDGRVHGIAESEVNTPIDLSTSPWRLTLIQLAHDDAILMIMVHHIAFDHWSFGILTRELRLFYTAYVTGEAPALEPLAVQYADYAEWQRERWHAPDAALIRQVDYWRGRLAGLEPVELPTDRPRPAVWDAAGDLVEFVVPRALARELVAVGRAAKATPFMVFLTALELLIGRYSGKRNFGVGVSIAGRSRIELEQMVGTFVKTVVQRTELSDDATFTELLTHTRKAALDAFEHQDVPLQRLVAELVPDPDLSRNPLFQVAFVVHNAEVEPLCLPDITVEVVPTPVTSAILDIALHMAENVDGSWTGRLTYPTALFDRARIERMAANYLALLANLAAAPKVPLSRVPTVSDAERTRLLGWNHPDGREAEAPLPDLFRAQAQATPDAVAVVAGDAELTYSQLDALVGGLAVRLPLGAVVGVCVPRGVWSVVGMLAAWRVGGAYVPLDPGFPVARLGELVGTAGVDVLVAEVDPGLGLPVVAPAVVAPVVGVAEPVHGERELAYVIFTSGSSGRPKAVAVEHGALSRHVAAIRERFGITAADRVLAFSSFTFDASLDQLLPALAVGATVVLRGDESWLPCDIPAVVARYGVTVVNLPPTFWAVLAGALAEHHVEDLARLRLLILGGEAIPAGPLAVWRARIGHVRVLNAYGPTETTVTSVLHEVTRDGPVPIGRPVGGRRVYVVDEWDELVPIGVPGELLIGGPELARGYLGQPGLTAARFVSDPFGGSGSRVYRTGDRVRWLSDGSLEFLGRTDEQVKIRGVRVELGEVEAVLSGCPGILAVAAAVRPDAQGSALVAYAVPVSGVDTAELSAALRAWCADRLPFYLVPSAFVLLEALPIGPGGKLIRAALPTPEPAASGRGRAPSTPDETTLCALFAEVLGVTSVSVDDGFFDLGGHSLLVIRLISRVRGALGKDLTVPDVFGAPTVASLTHRLRPLARPPMRRRADNGMPARAETAS